jgi:DnaJ-class molecular chaperone
MGNSEKFPTIPCAACDGEGVDGEYVPELCGEGEDRECLSCEGTGRAKLPWKYEVCGQCEGKGTSSAYLGAFTASEWAEQDDEFKEDYMSGKYDRPCETCGGRRVVAEVDRARCTPQQLDAFDKEQQEEYEDARCRAAESGWGHDRGHGF